MDWDNPLFVVILVTTVMVAWVVTTAIRARHGYPLREDEGNLVLPMKAVTDEATKVLADENRQLKETVSRLEDRLKVLERIATDPTRKLSDEIDSLP